MRFITPLFCIAILASQPLFAEGTKQLAPNASIDVMGNNTTDLAALHINNPSYNNFASYNNPDPQSRLNIHIKNPDTECILLGFNWAHNNVTSPNPPRINFEYRIKDPNGNIVYGPISVTPLGANIQTWLQGWTGPMQLHGVDGYDAMSVSSGDLTSQGWSGAGDFYIEFADEEGNDLLIDFWDITVVDCSTSAIVEKTGRVWSFNWSIFAVNDFGFPNRPFNGAFYVCAQDPDNVNVSFITKIDFNGSGFRPAAFNVAFNSFGSMSTGTVAQNRRSVENANATQSEYAIFLNDPVDICETATPGEISILGISRCANEEFCIKFTTTKAGQIDLLLDFDGGDNVYTMGTADVMISYNVAPNQVGIPTCIDWDGLDGLGVPLAEDVATQIPITITFAQGIYHFPIYDAELMTAGFMIEAVRPPATVPLLFYDDSNISVSSGSGELAVQLSGCATPCHRWTNYTSPTNVGFGNLNTINSWWFSQLIVHQDVLFLPSYYTCEIEGPAHLCQGGTTQLTFNPVISPAGADGGEIIGTHWEGPGIIGSNSGSSITIGSGGEYSLVVLWLTSLGDTCRTSCEHTVVQDPPATATIDTLIIQGQTVTINGQTFHQGGQYIQELATSEGCDSILTINIIALSTVIHYNLNACESFMSNGSHMDYTEFIPSYPQPLSCATIIADTLYRENPLVNKHSCTPGVNNSTAMCVGSLEGCTYIPGHEASVVIEVMIAPDADTAVHLTGFSFYEKAPTTYDWISGSTGPNNYPTWYRVRVLKNGSEIFLSEATPTSLSWNLMAFDFLDDDDFLVKDPTTFRFELLSYCPVGNGAAVSAWDLDEISIVASCASVDGLNKSIEGVVTTPDGKWISGVEMQLFDRPTFDEKQVVMTDHTGAYFFANLPVEEDYYIRGYKNNDFLNGVSTLDLIHIQKHLLGIKPFNSPYQFIAADANKSNSISALDLIELRKLLLGIYSTLPMNTSWRFGVAEQQLDISYPWLFRETYSIEYLNEHLKDVNFIGVKIGDLNGDVKLNAGSVALTPRSGESLKLNISDHPLAAGVPFQIDIRSDQRNNLVGLQLAFKMDQASIVDIRSGAIRIGAEHYLISNDGDLRLSWNEAEAMMVAPEEILFSLVVIPHSDGSILSQFHLDHAAIMSEAYVGEELEAKPISLEFIQEQNEMNKSSYFQVRPNPFSASTSIRFELESAGQATVRIFDLGGKLLFETVGDFEAGANEFNVNLIDEVVKGGLLLCQLQTNEFVSTQRILMLRK